MGTILADNGVGLPIANLPGNLGYDGSGNLITSTVVYNDNTYIQTYTWTDGNLTSYTRYEVQ
jgi:hypothetical protein